MPVYGFTCAANEASKLDVLMLSISPWVLRGLIINCGQSNIIALKGRR